MTARREARSVKILIVSSGLKFVLNKISVQIYDIPTLNPTFPTLFSSSVTSNAQSAAVVVRFFRIFAEIWLKSDIIYG
jgi:hypothetical protein